MFCKDIYRNILQLQKEIIHKEIFTKIKDTVYDTKEIKCRLLKMEVM